MNFIGAFILFVALVSLVELVLIAVYFPCHCILFGFHGFKQGAPADTGKKDKGKITNPEHLFISFSWEMKFSHRIPQPPFAFPFS